MFMHWRPAAHGGKVGVVSITVGIVEDDPTLKAAFEQLVNDEQDMTCIGSYPSAEDALAGLPKKTPDAVLMDINLPGMNGIHIRCIYEKLHVNTRADAVRKLGRV